MRRLPALLAALVAASVVAPAAGAHAKLVSTSPPDGAIVANAPTQIRVFFDDAVIVGPDNAVVRNGGASVLAGKPRVVAGGRELVLPVRKLDAGDYSVRWRILSDDGHIEGGVFAFRIGARTGPGPVSTLRAEGGGPSGTDVVSRWLYLAGILVAGGAALSRLGVGPIRGRAAANVVAVALVAVFLGGSSLLHSAGSGGATRFGHVVTVAVVVALLGATAAAVSTVYPRLLDLALLAGLALLAAPSLGGHALDAGRFRPLAFSADLVHVAAAAFWIGGLVQLALLLRAAGAEQAARRFSRLALPATALVGATGVLRALEELARASQLWTTGYGRAILVKSALFAALIGLGWTSRRFLASPGRLRRNVLAELAVLASVVGAVAVLTALAPGRDARAEAAPKPPAAGRPAPPPAGALVLAQRSGALAVAVAVQRTPLRVTATIAGSDGTGVDGLDVQLIAGAATSGARTAGRPCGHGCYTATLPFRDPRFVAVNFAEAGRFRSVTFTLPRTEAAGADFMRRAAGAFKSSRSIVYVERLSSGLGPGLVTTWRLQAPNRFAYAIRGGASGIVIGTRRWDQAAPGERWVPSKTTQSRQPQPGWGDDVADARVVKRSPGRVTVAWVNPTIPAWFEATFDARTARPVELRMTAAAHFMHHRYVAFDRPARIVPPNE